MEEFFADGFGRILQNASQKNGKQFQGQSVYKAIRRVKPNIKRGDQFYLDGIHKDHLEVFDKNGFFKHVLNLDGTINAAKTAAGKGRRI